MMLPSKRRLALGAILALLAGFVLWLRFQRSELDRRLARLRAEGVPLNAAELDAWYPQVPDDENAGKLVLNALGGFRDAGGTALVTDLSKRPKRGERPSREALAADETYLQANAPVLAALHAALAHPHARYPVDLKAGFVTPLEHLSPLKKCATKLAVCAEMAAAADQPPRAARILEDELRLAHTLEREPLLISFLVEVACDAITVRSAERILSLGPLGETDMASLQRAFQQAAETSSFERAMTGELATCVGLLNGGGAELGKLMQGTAGSGGTAVVGAIPFRLYALSGFRVRDLRAIVTHLDRLRLAARLGPAERRREVLEVGTNMDRELSSHFLLLARMLLPALGKAGLNACRDYARLRCAETAFAVERWRLAHQGSPPPQLEALVPQYLAAVPVDPVDGKPLKFRRRATGYVIYGAGDDGVDHGGLEKPAGSGQITGYDYTFVVER